MSGSSLADQLKQLGLAPKKAPKKSRGGKKQRPNGSKGKAGAKAGGEISLAEAYSQRASDDKRQREASAREKREKQQQRKALNDALAKIIKPASQNVKDAEIDRFFEHMGKIRKIFVTATQQKALNSAELGIVACRGGYHLVAPEIIPKVDALKADAVALHPQHVEEETP
ncbi:MAG: DUF2058 family protein [Lysobacterales bacterium]